MRRPTGPLSRIVPSSRRAVSSGVPSPEARRTARTPGSASSSTSSLASLTSRSGPAGWTRWQTATRWRGSQSAQGLGAGVAAVVLGPDNRGDARLGGVVAPEAGQQFEQAPSQRLGQVADDEHALGVIEAVGARLSPFRLAGSASRVGRHPYRPPGGKRASLNPRGTPGRRRRGGPRRAGAHRRPGPPAAPGRRAAGCWTSRTQTQPGAHRPR